MSRPLMSRTRMSRAFMRGPAYALLACLVLGASGAHAQIPPPPEPPIPPIPPMQPMHVDTDSTTIAGSKLILTDSLSDTLRITTDPTLSGHIRLSMQGGLSCLSIVSTRDAAVIETANCGGDAGALHITVPPAAPLVLTLSGNGDVQVADNSGASVVATLTGSGDLHMGQVGSLILAVRSNGDASIGSVHDFASLDMTGSGDVRIASLGGSLAIKQYGSGDVAIGSIESPNVSIENSGSGDILIGGGSVARLQAHLQGSGDLAMAATLGDGDVVAGGSADVKLGAVTGTLHRQAGSDSSIIVGGPSLVSSLIAEVARKIGNGQDHDGDSLTFSTPHIIGHVVAFLFVCLVLTIIWRLLRRNGGLAALRARGRRTAAPANQSVLSICDDISRLDQRLGRVEMYVTSREFDLQQKFRNL